MLNQKSLAREIDANDVMREEIVSYKHVRAGRLRVVVDIELQRTEIRFAQHQPLCGHGFPEHASADFRRLSFTKYRDRGPGIPDCRQLSEVGSRSRDRASIPTGQEGHGGSFALC